MEVIKFKITWYIYLNFPIIFSGRKRVFFFFFFFLHKRCLLCVVSCSISSEEEDIHKRDYNVSPITPRSAAQLRLRFLSRVGQQVRLILFILHRRPKCACTIFTRYGILHWIHLIHRLTDNTRGYFASYVEFFRSYCMLNHRIRELLIHFTSFSSTLASSFQNTSHSLV